MALVALVAFGAQAQEKKDNKKNANKPVFTTIKENKITSVKNQSRSGTCWDYSTLSFLEAEILKKAGKCEKCGRPFKIKNGRWGKFLACTGYPECKNIKKISKDK